MEISPRIVLEKCLGNFPGCVYTKAWGEKSIFYNPGQKLKHGVYVLTVKEKDGENDDSSRLDREGLFRLNTCVSKGTFLSMFKDMPKRPAAGGNIGGPWRFYEADVIMPHPVYAWMCWVSVLNPSEETFEKFWLLAEESYSLAIKKFDKRKII